MSLHATFHSSGWLGCSHMPEESGRQTTPSSSICRHTFLEQPDNLLKYLHRKKNGAQNLSFVFHTSLIIVFGRLNGQHCSGFLFCKISFFRQLDRNKLKGQNYLDVIWFKVLSKLRLKDSIIATLIIKLGTCSERILFCLTVFVLFFFVRRCNLCFNLWLTLWYNFILYYIAFITECGETFQMEDLISKTLNLNTP